MEVLHSIGMEQIVCGVCSIPFALQAGHLLRLRRTGEEFYCPAGHNINYKVGETDAQKIERLKLQVQREQEATRMAKADAQGERLKKEKAQAKVRRARAGVCVDCNRTFINVQRHRTSKHAKEAR